MNTPEPGRKEFLLIMKDFESLLEKGALSGEGRIEIEKNKTEKPIPMPNCVYFYKWKLGGDPDQKNNAN
jgi:hypothetical protein